MTLNPYIKRAKAKYLYFHWKQKWNNGSQYISRMPLTRSCEIPIDRASAFVTDKDVPARIHQIDKSMKFVLIVCEPTRRLLSDYSHSSYMAELFNETMLPPYEEWITDPKTGEIDDSVEQVQIGIYYMQLVKYLKYFPPNQILVVEGEKFKISPLKELNRFETFLGLENIISQSDFVYNETKGFYCQAYEGCMPDTKGRPHLTAPDALHEKVQRFYRPHDENLTQLLGYDPFYTKHYKYIKEFE